MTANLLVLTTFPDIDTAERLAQDIVVAKLAACVNILPMGRSIYRWEGKINTENEYIALIKTMENCYAKLESYIQQHHPYELPEIIVTPITNGSVKYLSWLRSELEA